MTAINQQTSEVPVSQYRTVNGIRLHYREAGNGFPLVLLHGSGPGATGWSNYSRNFHALAGQFRVICLDLPGWGQSDMKPVGSPMPGWHADILFNFLRELNIDCAHFIGNSYGGGVALKLALEHPEKVERLVLMGTSGGTPVFSSFPTSGIKMIYGFYEGAGPSPERLRNFLQDFVYDPSQITEEMVTSRLAAAMDPRVIENPPMRPNPRVPREELWRDARLTTLPHETLMIWGREDRVMPLDLAFVLHKQIPKARLLVMPQCGHWAQWEHADEFNATVSSFFAASTTETAL